MKVKRISEHIWSLRTWVIIPIHVWVVVEKGGVTLVDAGIPLMAKGIMDFIKELDADPLQRVLITHGHFDHIGALKAISAETRVPIFAHQTEIPYMVGALPYPRRKKAQPVVAKQFIRPLPEDEQGNLHSVAGLTVPKNIDISVQTQIFYVDPRKKTWHVKRTEFFTNRVRELRPDTRIKTFVQD